MKHQLLGTIWVTLSAGAVKACNPSYSEGRHYEDVSGQKSSGNPIATSDWAQWCTTVIPAMWRKHKQENHSDLGIKLRPVSKSNQSKQGWLAAQVVRVPAWQRLSPKFNPQENLSSQEISVCVSRSPGYFSPQHERLLLLHSSILTTPSATGSHMFPVVPYCDITSDSKCVAIVEDQPFLQH
jgi:hypothetical protein